MLVLQSYKKVFLWLVLLGVLYFFLRLYHLDSLPIFTDEAIYMRWAQIAANDASWRFISLTDGKQPSFIWLTMIAMQFIQDPLLAGRLVSVIAGFFTMVGLFFLARELFRNNWIGIFSSALYVLSPMALVYDRMALYDSLVGMSAVWSFYISLLLVRYVRLDIAFILALVLGGGMLTKTNAFFSAAFLPFTLLLFDWKRSERKQRLIKWAIYAFVAVVLAYAYYSVLRLSPYYHIIDQKNAEFVVPLKDLLANPFMFFIGNSKSLIFWLFTYLTPPLFVLVFLSFYFGGKKYLKELTLLFLWFLIPCMYLAFTGKIIYPRYILFMALSLLPMIAFSLYALSLLLKKWYFFVLLLLICFFFAIQTDYYILTDIKKASLPDKEQYVTGWSAGGGVKEAIAFFENEAKDKKIYVGTQGTFGLMPYALELYLGTNKNIQLQGFWPVQDDVLPEEVIKMSQKMPTYFLFYQPCMQCRAAGIAPEALPLEKVLQFEKDPNNSYLTVYEVSKN